jgi:hypothetical protein
MHVTELLYSGWASWWRVGGESVARPSCIPEKKCLHVKCRKSPVRVCLGLVACPVLWGGPPSVLPLVPLIYA